MKGNRYTEEQIIGFLKAHESGMKVADLVREHGFSEQNFYRWKSEFGGIQDQASARALVAQARKRAPLDPNAALELAVEETRAARKR